MFKSLEDVVDDYEKKLKEQIVQPDEFEAWKRNIVTQRLQNEIGYAMVDAMINDQVALENCESVALHTAYKNGMFHAFQLMLDWSPQEINDA